MSTLVNLPRAGLLPGDNKLTGEAPTNRKELHVGIVGAGCAGLFTAMTLDFINKRLKREDLEITYDILEAADESRLGGRLYTHHFSKGDVLPHDYYDVGAMRFPENDVMNRTFRLFKYLGLTKENGGLVPYYLEDYKKVCPTYFNDIRYVGGPLNGAEDPYRVNADYKDDDPDGIPKELLTQDPGKLVETAIKPFVDALKEDMDGTRSDEGWKLLESADYMSTRQFFRSTDIADLPPTIKPPIKGPGYNFNTTEWLETFAYATGWYNQSLAETVLEGLDFGIEEPTSIDNTKWLCVEGGTQKVARLMADKLVKKPELNRQVTKISTDPKGTITLTIKHADEPSAPTETRDYFAVFNSTTLGALQRMDLKDAGLRYGTKQAIRSLGYGASCKVGMKFKKAWWMKEPHNINKGGIAKTDRPTRVCVYPSYNINDDYDKPAVLLCSYTWAQDAQRIGTLISNPTNSKHETELKELLLNDLALLHSTPDTYKALRAELEELYDDHHAWDWYNDPNMSGAFAYFGPGQFSNMWPEIIQQNGWLFLVGEAASAHHAWIVGALESAIRGVYQMLDALLLQNPEYEPYRDAMKLLQDPYIEDDLPFGPLPLEIPKRQAGEDRKAPKTDVPEKGVSLTFTSAQVLLSFLEKTVEEAEAKVA
ncbi:uncharacterized protein BDZ99DRAFT_511735 [Mytilinidion resinicola]|uniref:Amine oxidase domain-containing protein n=1 Tax=Mytilinidion resinicola TaxID=574789 RepID=A0A6A6Y5K4_9PEZI|nr:uncharacterized protein BDZ99DRAFT_511735 [Mytilinidion resinicola]KAF2803940.1 hypothetical protein BDZ99DRAFT_511735 [Mytilinidion resinicola]